MYDQPTYHYLGYLTCDFDTKTAWIPNKEGRQEFLNSIQGQEFQNVNNAIHRSDKLLQLTLAQNAEKVELWKMILKIG